MKNHLLISMFLIIIFIGCEEETIDLSKAMVSTYAGLDSGYIDGSIDQAKFYAPTRIAVAPDGSLLVVENTKIRHISTVGMVTTFAGSNEEGYKNGKKSEARFRGIFGIAISGDGEIFLSEAGNFRIRKIDIDGNVSTYAGEGIEGYQDGPAESARFGNMGDIHLTNDHSLLVCDAHNLRIRKISKDGLVTTIAGGGLLAVSEGPANEVALNGVMDIVTGVDAQMYFVDSWGHRISKIATDGMISVVAGDIDMNSGFADGEAINAKFVNPMGISISEMGEIIIADTWNNRIRVIKNENEVITIAGDGSYGYQDGEANGAMFNQPFDVAAGLDENIYVADTYNHKIRVITF